MFHIYTEDPFYSHSPSYFIRGETAERLERARIAEQRRRRIEADRRRREQKLLERKKEQEIREEYERRRMQQLNRSARGFSAREQRERCKETPVLGRDGRLYRVRVSEMYDSYPDLYENNPPLDSEEQSMDHEDNYLHSSYDVNEEINDVSVSVPIKKKVGLCRMYSSDEVIENRSQRGEFRNDTTPQVKVTKMPISKGEMMVEYSSDDEQDYFPASNLVPNEASGESWLEPIS